MKEWRKEEIKKFKNEKNIKKCNSEIMTTNETMKTKMKNERYKME